MRFTRQAIAAVGLGGVLLLAGLPVAWEPGSDGPVQMVGRQRLQETDSDCGPASLQLVLRRLGFQVTLEELRRLAGTSEKGTSMLALKQTAEQYGIAAEGWQVHPDDLERLPLPAIVFFKEGHFAVLEKVESERIALTDPVRGQLVMPRSAFLKRWSEKVLIFASQTEGG